MSFGIGKDFEKNLGKSMNDLAVEPAVPQTEPTPLQTENIQQPAPEKPVVSNEPPLKKAEAPAPELNDEAILGYFQKQGKDIKSMDDLFKVKEIEKEIVKEINPYEGLIDEEDKAYFKYKKETGNSRSAWAKLNENITERPAIEIARERVRNETGLSLSNQEVDSYLEDTLGVDLSGDIDGIDNIKLNGYSKPYRDKLLADQEKYKKPLEESRSAQAQAQNMVTLKSGEQVTYQEYQKLVESDRVQYIENITKAANSVAASEFNIEIDDIGEKRTSTFKYEYSNDDRHGMLSDAKEIDAMIEKRYRSENGFNFPGLAEDIWWGVKENRQKVISAAWQQARAQAIEELAAMDNNTNFSQRSIQRQVRNEEGYGSLTGKNNTSGFGVKYTGFQKTNQ